MPIINRYENRCDDLRLGIVSLIVCFTVILTLYSYLNPAHAAIPADISASEFGESKYAVLNITDKDRKRVRPGDTFTLIARYIPFDAYDVHFHIYGAEPVSPDQFYIPTKIAMDPTPYVEWGEADFPPGEMHESLSLLNGQPVATISGKVATSAAPGSYTFTANTTFSACTDNICLAPSTTTLKWEMDIVAGNYANEIKTTPIESLRQPISIDYYADFSLPEKQVLGGGLDLVNGLSLSDDGVSAVKNNGFDPESVKVALGTDLPMWKILLLSLLGGLILNVMPCVLPVVSIKAISLINQIEKQPKTVINHTLIFSAGIVTTFLFGALVIALFQSLGTKLGWGAQFQSPAFVIIMASIMFVFGLSLADVFKIKAPQVVTDESGELAEQEGYGGSFFKGVLATLLGTPCVGPFLGASLIVAFTLGSLYTILIFLFVGIGMAIPYLLLLPFFLRRGRRECGQLSRKLLANKGWMQDFKHGMSFLMFASVIYLLYILEGLLGGRAVVWGLVFLLAVSFAAWLFGKILERRPGLLGAAFSALLVLVLGGWFTMPRVFTPISTSVNNIEWTQAGWEIFSLAKLQALTAQGKTVLLDFTADWCPNCKTNEALALNIESTKKLKEELGIIFMVADWTARDDEIGTTLRNLGYASVPLTAIFPGANPNSPILLDGVYGPTRVQDAMRRAALSNND